MNNKLTKMFNTFESSVQYYYFTDEILNSLNNDPKSKKWFTEWMFKEGPGSDERHDTLYSPMDYVNNDILTSDEINTVTNYITDKKWVTEAEEEEEEVKEKPKEKEVKEKPKENTKYVVGTIVLITNYGTDSEPQLQMWNNSYGEIRQVNNDGTYKIAISDITDSEVAYSKKWAGREDKAIQQRLTMPGTAFKSTSEIKAEEEAAK